MSLKGNSENSLKLVCNVLLTGDSLFRISSELRKREARRLVVQSFRAPFGKRGRRVRRHTQLARTKVVKKESEVRESIKVVAVRSAVRQDTTTVKCVFTCITIQHRKKMISALN